MSALKSLCVYCGSSPGDDRRFKEAACTLGADMARRGVRLVYGGGGMGLMGETARTVRDAGGDVFGVIPEFLLQKEGLVEGINHQVVTTMHERKMLMFDEADAFCALPGGIGTLEEVIETLSWARLDLHRKPVIVVNIDNFWSPLLDLMGHIVDRGFAPAAFRDCIVVVESPEEVIGAAEKRLVKGVI
ncbi:MAG: TIGR00730 family Rossman fold protein [Pseudomonadota bacterium]